MEKQKKIMAVVNTRPDAIKMCPLIKELRAREGISVVVCSTGQHRELLSEALKLFSVKPDYELGVMKEGQDLFHVTSAVLLGIGEILRAERPDILMVHGDTTGAFAAALAGFYEGVPVHHVEAGLRSADIFLPFPEEFNRRAIGLMASYHFAPTVVAGENLYSEGVACDNVSVTGNTVIDALRETVCEDFSHPVLNWAEGTRLILLTAHRRENQGEGIRNIFSAVRRMLAERDDVRVVYPVHPSPAVSRVAREFFAENEKVMLCPPLDARTLHNLLAKCYFTLTDSGGIQEEAVALGIPVLVARNNTERREGLLAGGMRLVGVSEETVYRGMRALLDSPALRYAMSEAENPFGEGSPSRKIADVIGARGIV